MDGQRRGSGGRTRQALPLIPHLEGCSSMPLLLLKTSLPLCCLLSVAATQGSSGTLSYGGSVMPDYTSVVLLSMPKLDTPNMSPLPKWSTPPLLTDQEVAPEAADEAAAASLTFRQTWKEAGRAFRLKGERRRGRGGCNEREDPSDPFLRLLRPRPFESVAEFCEWMPSSSPFPRGAGT